MVIEAGSLRIRGSIDLEDVKSGLDRMKGEMQKAGAETGKLFGGVARLGKEAGLSAINFERLGVGAVGIVTGLAAAFGPASQVAMERFGIQAQQAGIIFDQVAGPALNSIADTFQELIPLLDQATSAMANFRETTQEATGTDFDPFAAGIAGVGGAGILSLLTKGKFPFLRGALGIGGAFTALDAGLLSPQPPESAGQFALQAGGGAAVGGAIGGLPGAGLGALFTSAFTLGKFGGQALRSEEGQRFIESLSQSSNPQFGTPSSPFTAFNDIILQAQNVTIQGGSQPSAV